MLIITTSARVVNEEYRTDVKKRLYNKVTEKNILFLRTVY